jgi:hypothetical protein
MLLDLLQAPTEGLLPWREFISFGPGFVALIVILVFLIRMAPTWKEVKIRELDLRSSEVGVRGEEAKALGMLADVLRDVAVEQRKATETQRSATEITELLQRVNADRSEKLSSGVEQLSERFDRLEKLIVITNGHEKLETRVNALEHPA